jgi:hypothetical protein
MLRDASGNRQRHKTLGTYPELSLKDARRLAQADGKMSETLFNKATVGHLAKELDVQNGRVRATSSRSLYRCAAFAGIALRRGARL